MSTNRSQARRPKHHARAQGVAQGIESQYRALLEAIPDLIFHLDGEGRFLDFSPAKGLEPALPPAEFLGRTVREVMPADLAAEIMLHVEQALQTGDTQVFEYTLPIPLPDGNPRDFEARIAPSDKGQVVGVVRDVTGPKRAHEALRESEAKYRQVFEHVHDVFFRTDMNGVITEVSPSTEWWGYDPEDLIGSHVADFYADLQVRPALQKTLLEQGRIVDQHVRLKAPDGRVLDASASFHLLRGPDGAPLGIEGIARDVSGRMRAEEALEESEQRLRNLVRNAPIALFAVDREGVFTAAEGEPVSLVGLRSNEYVGRSVFDMFRHIPGVVDAARRALAGEAFTTTIELQGHTFEANVAPVRDEGGRIKGAVAVGTDITDRARAEERLRIQRDLALALSATTDLQETLRLCLQAAIRVSDLDSGCVYLGDRSSGTFHLAEHEGLGDEFAERILRFEAGSAYVQAAMTGKPLYTQYKKLVTKMDRPRRREGLRALAAVPVQHGGEVIACLCVASHSLDDIPPASRAALEAIAARIGSAIARSRTDEALRESEERFRRLAEDSIDGILLVEGLEVRFANAAFVKMFGYESDGEIVGRPFTDFVSLAYRELMVERGRARSEGRDVPERYEFRPLRKDGSEFDAEISVSTITHRGGWARLGIIRDITERKRAEGALRESEERFRSLAEGSIDGILLVRGLKVRFANAALVEMLGYGSDEEILGRPFTDLVAADYREMMVEWGRARDEGRAAPARYEFRPLRKDGSEFYAEISVSTITYQRRHVRLGVIRDITERKRAEEALRESETKFRTLAETAAAAVFIYRERRPLYVNATTERVTGYTREEILGRELWQLAHPDFQSLVRERSRARQRGKPALSRYEFKIVTKGGEERWVDFTAGMIEFEGQPAAIGTAYDITERKRAEEALRQSEDRFRGLSEATLEGIVIHDSGLVLDANPQVAAMLGYELSEIIGKDPLRFIAPDYHDLVRQNVAAGTEEAYEVQGLRKDGTTFPMEVCGKTISYEDRQVRVGVVRDITERKRAEEALRESENRFRTLSEASFEGIAIHDKGPIVDGNQAFASMFGYALSETIGMHVLDFVAPESCDLVLRNIASKYPEPFEFTGLRKDGTTFPVEVCGKAIPYRGKMVTVAALRDLTERKQMEEALQKAREELEARVERQMERGDSYGLTFRELTVLYLMAAGKADKEIAFQLGISPRTASKHVENILQKMGVASRTEASVRALRQGLVSDGR